MSICAFVYAVESILVANESAHQMTQMISLPAIGSELKIKTQTRFLRSAELLNKKVYVMPECGSCGMNDSKVERLMRVLSEDCLILASASFVERYQSELKTLQCDVLRLENQVPEVKTLSAIGPVEVLFDSLGKVKHASKL